MTKKQLKTFCRDEFGVINFYRSSPEFETMFKVFGVPLRTIANWSEKDIVRPYFDASVKMYFENKKLSENLKVIYKKLISS